MSVLKGDFIGFTFNNVHSSNLGIIRTSNGSRFDENLLPTSQDKTVQIPGGDGTYYFGSYYTQRNFNIPIAFDSLSESDFRNLREVFGNRKINTLIFDESPYKIYMVKCTGIPQLKYICFENIDILNERFNYGDRIYKGEGTINFTAYFPFAKSRFKYLDDYTNSTIPEWGANGEYNNKEEWKVASRMKDSKGNYYDLENRQTINLFNAGDLETDFLAYFPFPENGILGLSQIRIQNSDSYVLGALELSTITKIGSDTYIRINSKTNLIEGCIKKDNTFELTGTVYNSNITAGDFFKIPLGESTFVSSGANCEKVEYDYLYY